MTKPAPQHAIQASPLLCLAKLVVLLTLAVGNLAPAEQREAPQFSGVVEPRPAPEWDIAHWLNGYPGNVTENRGKVIVIDFFQLWCPGCNTFTGPVMQQWQQRYADEIASDDLLLVKIHTVFEGHDYQTVKKLKEYLTEKNITLPVAVDRHRDDYRPETKLRYNTRGTPEVVIIDREGMIRFQKFGFFDAVAAEQYIDYLLGGPVSEKRKDNIQICLASELCGQG